MWLTHRIIVPITSPYLVPMKRLDQCSLPIKTLRSWLLGPNRSIMDASIIMNPLQHGSPIISILHHNAYWFYIRSVTQTQCLNIQTADSKINTVGNVRFSVPFEIINHALYLPDMIVYAEENSQYEWHLIRY